MKIDRVHIQNFRNFNDLDVRLGPHAVIVGENRAGKSNFLYALRLLLDPSLPDSARQLREEDFWDGLPRPLANEAKIVIEIDLAEFESDENQLATLGEHLVSAEPMISRLTYLFQRVPGTDESNNYEFSIYGGNRPENIVHGEIRRRLPFDFLGALRDAEGDLASWKRSPLRFLLEQAMAAVKPEELDSISKLVTDATKAVSSLTEIKELCDEVTARLTEMVGVGQGGNFVLGLAPTDAYRLVRALRPFVDGGRRGISEASLGAANLIYLALKSLEFEQLVKDGHRDHTFLGIEEPEAHLHPHLQRLTFRHFFEELVYETTTVLLTTHSPHIVSVTPLRSLVVIRSDPVDGSEAVSTVSVKFSEEEVADLQRYLDVTRGEMVFSRGVLLVEGEGERFLVPALAKLNHYDLDKLGITVCSVAGTNFEPYVKLLDLNGLDIPYAVLTDYDPAEGDVNLGLPRAKRLLEAIGRKVDKNLDGAELSKFVKQRGIFVNEHTLEVDLYRCGQHQCLGDTLIAFSPGDAARERAQKWRDDPKALDSDRYLSDITAIGKGRFAQRVAGIMKEAHCPPYILEAIQYVAAEIE